MSSNKKVKKMNIIPIKDWDNVWVISLIRCHMLFIAKEETNTISKVKKVLDEKTLLVTELKDISNSSSSMINFVYVQSRLKFQINKSEAEKNNFKIGQTLTKLAYSTI